MVLTHVKSVGENRADLGRNPDLRGSGKCRLSGRQMGPNVSGVESTCFCGTGATGKVPCGRQVAARRPQQEPFRGLGRWSMDALEVCGEGGLELTGTSPPPSSRVQESYTERG